MVDAPEIFQETIRSLRRVEYEEMVDDAELARADRSIGGLGSCPGSATPAGRSALPFTYLAESTASPWQRRGKAAIPSKIRM
jgi:hypothetical protein